MLQVLAKEEHLDEARVAKSLGNLSSAFDDGIEAYVYSYICMYVLIGLCINHPNCTYTLSSIMYAVYAHSAIALYMLF